MKIGFTGTRGGMTTEQHRSFIAWIRDAAATEFHHGCCIGSDADAAEVASSRDLGFARPRIVAHPPINNSKVSATEQMFADETRPPLDYLTRNRNIVDACDVLLACPKGPEERRSGTWSTIRYARKCGKRVVIFWPNGEVTG